MLKQFYNYLSEKVIKFLSENNPKPASRFDIQFEDEDQVKKLYESLKECEYAEKFNYLDDNGNTVYETYSLNFNGTKVIVSATMDGIQPDFLTTLRNLVGTKGYENNAILFIHNTSLDSIINGAESFNKEGMPFHIDSVTEDLKKKLSNSELSSVDRAIIELELKNKRSEFFLESGSIFEYKELLNIINKPCIEAKNYKDFGLFYDKHLAELSGKALDKKLVENSKYFEIVEEAHNYGTLDSQLDKYFDEKGQEKLLSLEWQDLSYDVVEKSAENKKNNTVLSYSDMTCNVKAIDREKGKSKVMERTRNILVFNHQNIEDIEINANFDNFVKTANIVTEKNLIASASGKKLKITIKNDNKFSRLVYNDDGTKFEFKILIVNFEQKLINSIIPCYTVNPIKKQLEIESNESEFVFNDILANELVSEVKVSDQEIELSEDYKNIVRISDDFSYDESEDIDFYLKYENESIKCVIHGTKEKTVNIDGFKIWKTKREKNKSYEYYGDNKIRFGTSEYCAKEDFRKFLELEKYIISDGGMYFKAYSDEDIETVDLEVSESLKDAYTSVIEYMKNKKQIPSLIAITEEFKSLLEIYLTTYIENLNTIEDKVYLNKANKDLFKLGTIKREFDDREILFTPLHPINIAYQLLVNENIGTELLDENTLKKLTSTYLLPYLSSEDDDIYIPIEQSHSPEWTCYVNENLPRYKGSKKFVSKLVVEKINEFVDHFKYLFTLGGNVPIKINLINTGDSKEIFEGIFKYYVEKIRYCKKEKKDIKVNPMDVYIYSDKTVTNAFEEVAFNDDLDELFEIYDLKCSIDKSITREDVMDIVRENVHFYSKEKDDEIEYSHLTFVEMDNAIKSIPANMEDIKSGTILNGLISGVPSVFLGDSYRTGFGTRYIDKSSKLINIAMKLNAMNVALTGSPFESDKCKMVSVSNSSKSSLEKIYNSSNWVTFISPKVDLNFFKNDPNSKELLIIHYSDQYTTAGGYDAITVTRKSIPYQKLIEEFLVSKDVADAKAYTADVINMFNAINGDWLLRMISRKSHFSKEKISILSAIKLALAYFKRENTIWIPISLEEVLRVSGGAGLKQSEGFFSTKNLGFANNGATSDDILLIGIEKANEDIKVHYYPIEVKIGINDSSYIKKGVEQANKTKELLIATLGIGEENIDYNKKIYRNFMMQLAVNSAEKLNLYNVGNKDEWDQVINSDIRRKLLNEEYTISTSFDEEIGRAGVISFKSGVCFNNSKIQENVKVIEYSEDDGVNYITKSIDEISNIIEGNFTIENKNVSDEEVVEINLEKEEITNKALVNEIDFEKTEICNEDEESYEAYNKVAPTNDETNRLTEVEFIQDTDEDYFYEKSSYEYNFSSGEVEILFGTDQKTGKDLNWYPTNTDKVFHTNTGIIGQMGTGKTQFTKSVITQLHREGVNNVEGKDIGILIFDYKGDYNENKMDFVEATSAKVYPLYRLPFNPLSIIKPKAFKPMMPLHTASSLAETITKAFRLGAKQNMALKDIIMEAYELKGISKINPSSWENTAPTMNEVYQIYLDSENFKEDSLYAALKNLAEFEIFEVDANNTKPLFDLIDGVTVIDLSGYDPSIQNLVVAITLDLFYSQMQAMGHSKIEGNLRQINKIILVDEADNFLSEDFTSIKKILKEGREFGVGTILSTQLLSHFSTGDNDYSNYILTWIIHSVTDINNKDVKYIFNTQSKADEEILCNKIKSLTKHYSLVKMGDSDKPIEIKDKAFWELIQ
ncbi:MAG: DNA phosphorothioation-dependent restriction protein DptH [Sarcina sp.]